MKNLNTYIQEKLKIVHNQYSYVPQSKEELKEIIKERLIDDPNADLNDIDVSNITNMAYLFEGLDPHDIDISQWDVSNVQNMRGMFFQCRQLTADLSTWDVSKAKDMYAMFFDCAKFNSDLSNWDVSNVKDMYGMFNSCDSMKELPKWYVEKQKIEYEELK